MADKRFILAIDQGTTGTTALVIDEAGRIQAHADEDFEQFYPQPGWVEHDLELIWRTTENTVRRVLEKTGVNPKNIAAIGITNQRETVGLWERATGKPLGKAVVWQCRRTTDACRKLKKAGKEKLVSRTTGLLLDPYFSATKIQWMFKNFAGALKRARAGEVCAGTIDAFLVHRLTGGETFATDVSNASRTMLMSLKTLDWDEGMLKLFDVPRSCLPAIADSSGRIGATKGLSFLPDGIPIAGIAGDQQSALFGQACFGVGQAKCTYGTGSFILLNTGTRPVVSKNRLLTTVAWRLAGKPAVYALEGGAFVCGAAVQWLRDELGFIKSSSEVEDLAREVEDTAGVQFVPALTGLGAPYWNPEARGLFCGITRGTRKAHVARATLEAMALQNVDILASMEKDTGKKMSLLRVDGGASQNNLLMQMQSDFMGRPVERPAIVETTAMGAAFLAGLGVGLWKSTDEIARQWRSDRVFKSAMTPKARTRRMKAWHEAVERAL